MKIDVKNPPRTFTVNGAGIRDDIHDCGTIALAPNEQVTLVTEAGGEYDVTRKAWGFYATPSMNGRLKNYSFKTALVENEAGRLYIMIVEADRMDLFEKYCRDDHQTVLRWFDEHPERSK